MGRPIGSVTRSTMRDASDHLLAGLLFDDAGYRMVLTHATKGQHSLSLLCLVAASPWRIQDSSGRIGLPRSSGQY
jgi:hypothetical protein